MSDRLAAIALAAISVDTLRGWKRALQEARNRFWCQRAEALELDIDQRQDQPCWKTYIATNTSSPSWDPDYTRLPEEQWCESCRRRELVHQRFVEISRRLGAARGVLTRRIRNREARHA